MKDLKDKPFLYLFIVIATTALTVIGSLTLATTGFVEKEDAKVKEFIKSSHEDVKLHLKNIKSDIRENHKLILDILKREKK